MDSHYILANNSSRATGPVVTIFYVEPPGAKGTKICSKGPGQMTNMAALPICGLNLLKSSHREPIVVCDMDIQSSSTALNLSGQGHLVKVTWVEYFYVRSLIN